MATVKLHGASTETVLPHTIFSKRGGIHYCLAKLLGLGGDSGHSHLPTCKKWPHPKRRYAPPPDAQTLELWALSSRRGVGRAGRRRYAFNPHEELSLRSSAPKVGDQLRKGLGLRGALDEAFLSGVAVDEEDHAPTP